MEIKDKCVFSVKADQCLFQTQTNGDTVTFYKGVHISAEDSAAFAYMIQMGKELKVVIKEA